MGPRIVAVALVLLTAAPIGTAHSQETTEGESGSARSAAGPTWRLEWTADLSVLAIEATIGFGWSLGSQLAPAHCAPVCDGDEVWAIDRFAAGWYDEGWSLTGDIGVAVVFGGAVLALAFDEGFVPMLSDVIVVAEAAVGAIALSILSNMSTRRPRPHLYGTESPEAERMSGQAGYSFYSGHTAGAVATAVATFMTLRERHPDRWEPYLVLGIGLGMASTVGVARLMAGQHFLTDVIAGAVVGGALGLLVPSLHKRQLRIVPNVTESAAGLSVVGRL